MCSKPKRICSSLCNWPIFNSLEPQFVSQIHMVLVYGKLGNQALIVTKDKMVYGLGNNDDGCLGIGDEDATLEPKKIEALCGKDIKTFAYGIGSHVLALTKKGEVYSWGLNNYGQLGIEPCDQVTTPILVQIPILNNSQGIIDIVCSNNYSVALTEDGTVYTWGENTLSQLGRVEGIIIHDDTFDSHSSIPASVNCNLAEKKVVQVSCGGTFTIAITDNGKVYGWGINLNGQLGIKNDRVREYLPQWIDLGSYVIVKVVCGYDHTLALSDQGEIFAWGNNDYGQLGNYKLPNHDTPTIINNSIIKHKPKIKWVDIAALINISVAVNEEGHVYVWGDCRGERFSTPTVTPFSDMHDAIARYGSTIMHQPLILYADEGSNLLECLKALFDDPSTSDLKIKVEDKYINVHKTVLRIRSSFFGTMYRGDWTEKDQGIIDRNDFSYIVYKAYFKYLYTNVIDLPIENIAELLDLAKAYCESDLQKHCIGMIKKNITVSNVAYFYSSVVKYDTEAMLQELEDFCVKFAGNHLSAVKQTEHFAKLDRDTMKTFIIKADEAGGSSSSSS